jgi:hypothetical protein
MWYIISRIIMLWNILRVESRARSDLRRLENVLTISKERCLRKSLLRSLRMKNGITMRTMEV